MARLTFLFCLVLAGLCVPTARADLAEDVAEVRAASRQLHLAIANRDTDATEARLAPDLVTVAPYYEAPLSASQTIAALAELDITDFEASEVTVAVLDFDTALASYFLAIEGTYAGTSFDVEGFVTEIYVRRDGRWLQRLSQMTELADR